jgi:hypothetical protein
MDNGYHGVLLGCRLLRLLASCRSRAGGSTLAEQPKMRLEAADQPSQERDHSGQDDLAGPSAIREAGHDRHDGYGAEPEGGDEQAGVQGV